MWPAGVFCVPAFLKEVWLRHHSAAMLFGRRGRLVPLTIPSVPVEIASLRLLGAVTPVSKGQQFLTPVVIQNLIHDFL
jgi:hypothetical protein